MKLEEYMSIPIDNPATIELGAKFRVKSERQYKPGDNVSYWEVISIKKEGFEYILKFDRLEEN